jgi:hypothetical protein
MESTGTLSSFDKNKSKMGPNINIQDYRSAKGIQVLLPAKLEIIIIALISDHHQANEWTQPFCQPLAKVQVSPKIDPLFSQNRKLGH